MNVDAVKILEGMEDDLSREAIGLFTSPRNQRITHINNNFEVIDPESNRLTILKGVTTSLKSYVWPHYNYTELAENVKYLPEELRGEKPPDGVSELDGVGINSGSRRGSRVHGEVEMFVHGHHESVDFKNTEYHPLTLDVINHIINPSSRRAVVMDRSTVDHGLGFDAWIILAAEFKLFDVDTGIASAVDIVCINADGVLCFIELKVGHAQTWHSSCGTMIGTGSSNVALSPLNQALVQVGMYGVMASCKYNIRNLRMVVLNVNYSGVREYCVTPDFLTRVVTPIYLHVKESIRIEKQQRIADREARKAERKRLREQYGSAIAKKIIKELHETNRSRFTKNFDTLQLLVPDSLLARTCEIKSTLESGPEATSDGKEVEQLSMTVDFLWDVISELSEIAPSVKIERARLCHTKGAAVRVYNSSISQQLDAGDSNIDRTTLSPFSH